jgi:predicted GH43/DUF377 family glycosyl hydrolase
MSRVFSVVSIICFYSSAYAQTKGYLDKRPQAILRMNARDEGIVLRYGNGPDSCDILGAREAIINKEGNTYYLYYDGAGNDGWKACIAVSKNLKKWAKKGAILKLGASGSSDAKSASAPWAIKENDTWHMFYLGTPNASPAPDRVPLFPYLTMKAKSNSLAGPFTKQYDVTPFATKENTFYSVTASPGFIVKNGKEYMMFFSGATTEGSGYSIAKRTLGIARTKYLDSAWQIDEKPIVPLPEQIENSSLYYEPSGKYWYLFTNHIGIDPKDSVEYTDAIWVYWSKDLNKWNTKDKAVVLDSSNCSWSKGAIGMPSVIKAGNRLALLYDAFEGYNTFHMRRNIGLAWLKLPLKIPAKKKGN